MKHMSILGMVLVCMLMIVIPVNAQEFTGFDTVSGSDAVIPVAETSAMTSKTEITTTEIVATKVQIPDVIGLSEEDALVILDNVKLPEGMKLEIIKKYKYSSEILLDEVFEQSPVGTISLEELPAINLTISMGPEPKEVLAVAMEKEVEKMGSFGIATYLAPTEGASSSMMGIDWDSLPCSYEFNWDNSSNCWYWGMWYGGECYKTPEGEYDNNVRHKMQLYCDGTNVYLHIVFATVFGQDVNGNDFRFFVDDEMAAFQIEGQKNKNLGNVYKKMKAGTEQVSVVHRNPRMSGDVVDGALAYLTKNSSGLNGELEVMIPLSQFAYQNSDIDINNIGSIEFHTYNLMYRRITASGASTFPLTTAGVAFLVIPGSTVLLQRYGKRKKSVKDSDEQNV